MSDCREVTSVEKTEKIKDPKQVATAKRNYLYFTYKQNKSEKKLIYLMLK